MLILTLPGWEPWKTIEVGFILAAWVGGEIVGGFALKRAFTPIRLDETAIHAGSRKIPYLTIARVESRPDSWTFRVVLTSGKELNLSKIGISTHPEFFEELNRRVRA